MLKLRSIFRQTKDTLDRQSVLFQSSPPPFHEYCTSRSPHSIDHKRGSNRTSEERLVSLTASLPLRAKLSRFDGGEKGTDKGTRKIRACAESPFVYTHVRLSLTCGRIDRGVTDRSITRRGYSRGRDRIGRDRVDRIRQPQSIGLRQTRESKPYCESADKPAAGADSSRREFMIDACRQRFRSPMACSERTPDLTKNVPNRRTEF